jgi:C4-dicarboxylate transporter, DctQ subunit
MRRLLSWWNALENTVVALLAAAALCAFLYGMVARFMFPWLAPDWSLEVTVFLMIWAMLLAAGQMVSERRHIAVDLVIRMLPQTGRRVAVTLAALTGIGFCSLLVVSGWQVLEFALLFDERSQSTLRIPMVWYYASLPVAMALMALRYLFELPRIWREPIRFEGEDEPS